jgi:hypothetical protein
MAEISGGAHIIYVAYVSRGRYVSRISQDVSPSGKSLYVELISKLFKLLSTAVFIEFRKLEDSHKV